MVIHISIPSSSYSQYADGPGVIIVCAEPRDIKSNEIAGKATAYIKSVKPNRGIEPRFEN